MKHILITTIAAVLLVGCGGYEQPATSLQTNSVEAVAEIDKTELTSESAVGLYKWVRRKITENQKGVHTKIYTIKLQLD